MKPKKKPPQFAKRKRAFDAVLEAYRGAKDTGGIGAIAMGGGGKGVSNPAKPSLTDLRCDVDKVVNKCCPRKIDRLRFRLAYIEYDSPDPIEMGRYADKMIVGKDNLEQGIGALFISREIYPIKKYFKTIRQWRVA
jgi:hypothetical protein